MLLRVTATVSFEYDTDDGIVLNRQDAVDDTLSAIDSGDIPASQYTVSVEEVPADAPQA